MAASNANGSVRRLLLVQLAALGDVVLCTPAIRAARAALPDARIDFLSRGPGVDALSDNPHLNEVLAYPESLRDRLALIRRVRAAGYDAVVDLHSNPRTAVVTALSGAPVRVGWERRGPRNRAYTLLVPVNHAVKSYTAWHKVEMLRALGLSTAPLETADLSLEIWPGERERRWADETWARLGLDAGGEPVVALSAVSRQPFKDWGAERWAAVADRLIEAGARVLLTNGPGELPQVEAVVAHMRHRPAWGIGETTVRGLAALYQRCAFWIGNDGGPRHIAAAAGLTTITVIRWQLGEIWTDARPGGRDLFFDRPPPQGCDRKCRKCTHFGCLAAVRPDEVYEAAARLLAERRARRDDRHPGQPPARAGRAGRAEID